MAKGNPAPTTHDTTARAKWSMKVVHIDTAGPFLVSLGGLGYVVMFVDSASHLQRPYGTRDKSAAAILAVVKRFTVDMGVTRALRSDNGAQHTNHSFVEYCDDVGIRRELTAPYTPQQYDSVESAFWTAKKQGTQNVWEFRTSTPTSAWKTPEVLRTRRQLVLGWSHCFGLQNASIDRLPRPMTDGSPP